MIAPLAKMAEVRREAYQAYENCTDFPYSPEAIDAAIRAAFSRAGQILSDFARQI